MTLFFFTAFLFLMGVWLGSTPLMVVGGLAWLAATGRLINREAQR